jgi:hypothetical protein
MGCVLVVLLQQRVFVVMYVLVACGKLCSGRCMRWHPSGG